MFPLDGSQMNRTRTTLKALPASHPPPSPLRMVMGLLGDCEGHPGELRLNALQSDLYRSLRLDSFHAAINLLAYLDLPGAGDAHNISPCLL